MKKKNDNKPYHFPSLSWKPIRNQEHTVLHSCFIKTKQALRKRKKTLHIKPRSLSWKPSKAEEER